MKVTIERFNTGGGWYLNVDDRTVAALLPDDIEYITKRFGPTSKFKLVHDAVEAEYALEMEAKKLGVELTKENKELRAQLASETGIVVCPYCFSPDCLYRTETALGHRDCPKHGGKR